MKTAVSLIALLFACQAFASHTVLTTDQQIDLLISKMTLKEKVSLVTGDDPVTHAIPRLGIPAIDMNDGPLGVRRGHSTAFPSGLTQGSTFDPDIINAEGIAIADEARAKKIGMMLGPCVNITRQPFGGRNFESYGEDPLLSSVMAASYIRGMQSHNVIATVKHFATNDQEIERNTISTSIDIRTLMEIHLPMFKAAVDAGVWSVMAAYNRINGVYASENGYLLNTVLRDMWHFQGFVVSDWGATHSTVGPALAGMDLEMPSGSFWGDHLERAVLAKKIPVQVVEEKDRRLLRAMFAMGMMGAKKALPAPLGPDSSEHQALAQKIAEEGTVLLKNDGLLPLKAKTIAVIGPNAAHLRTGGGGSSHVIPFRAVSPLEALRARFAVNYASGAEIDGDQGGRLVAKDFKDGKIRADYFRTMDDFAKKPFTSREEAAIELSADKKLDDRYGVRFTGELLAPMTGEFVFTAVNSHTTRIWLDGKKIVSNTVSGDAQVAEASVKLVKGHAYRFVLESGRSDDDTEDTLEVGWRFKDPNLLAEAVEAATKSEAVVMFLGIGNEMEGEGADRESLDLPQDQVALLNAVSAVNPNIVVVLNGGGIFTMPWLAKTRALMQAWYPGSEGGFAIARLLSGDANPSGKLPISYIKRWEDSSAYGRYPGSKGVVPYTEGVFVGYRYLDRTGREPLFPFGFGLSYSTFEIKNLQTTQTGAETFELKFDVTNTGSRDGAEVAQVYVGEKNPSVPRPPRELKGFKRVMLKAGETQTVTLALDPSAFAFFDVSSMKWKVNPGVFEISIGSSSRDLPLRTNVTVQ